MRKTILLLFVLLCTGVVLGQNEFGKKRVAVATPTATAGVDPIDISIVRGKLVEYISIMRGYSAFTRTDIDQITKEMSFEQSGMVNDADKKKLGFLKGVDLILVSTLTYGRGRLNVEAKFIHVESGQVENAISQVMNPEIPEDMEKSCKILTERLVGKGSNSEREQSDDIKWLTQPLIAYVDASAIYLVMPESAEIDNALKKLTEQYEREMKRQEDEYNKKLEEYQKGHNNWTESVKEAKIEELQNLQIRMQEFYQQAQKKLMEKQEEMQNPIREKMRNAIRSVEKENNIACTLDEELKSKVADGTPLVKKKLGIFCNEQFVVKSQTQPQIAYVDVSAIYLAMPEVAEIDNKIKKLTEQHEKEMKRMEDAYNEKLTVYQKENDNCTESVKKARVEELQNLQARVQNYYTSAKESLEKTQEEMQNPIREKVRNAIQSVEKENSITYTTFDESLKDKVTNVTPLVKKKLGIFR